ncbi:hypothetical protein Tco_0278447 [Tanacetum coccineum]
MSFSKRSETASKFPETFLCFIGISRYYEFDDDVYPVFLTNDDEEMDLFAFINHVDPTKVRIGEKQIEEGKTLLLKSTKGCVVPLIGVNDQGDQNDDVQDDGNQNDDVLDAGHDVNEEGVADGQENLVEADIVCIEDEVLSIVAEKAKGSRKNRKATGRASGSSLPPKKLRADHGTFGAGASTGGKFVAALQGLLESGTLLVEVGDAAVTTLLFITSSLFLTPKREGDGHTDSATGPDLLTQHLAERFIVLSDSPWHSSSNAADVEVSSIAMSLVPDPPIMTTAIATTVVADISFVLVPRSSDKLLYTSIFTDSTSAGMIWTDTLQQIYVPKWDVVNNSALDDAEVCRNMVNHLAPPRFFSQLRAMDYEQLFMEFNVGVARQTCLSAGLSLKKSEAAEAIRLRGQVYVAEATEATRVAELNDLKERTMALEGQVATLESAVVIKDTELASSNTQITKLTQDMSNVQLSCNEFSIKAYSLESEKDKLADQVSTLETTCIDADFMGMSLHLDEEFYPRFLTTISGRRWILSRILRLMVMKCLQSLEYLVALGGAIGRAIDKGMQDGLTSGIIQGKTGRGLADVAAYNPSVKANYVSAVNALCAVDFLLLAQLASQKDASMSDIMDLFRLKGPVAKTPEANQLQPSLEQLMLPILIQGYVASYCLSLSDVMVPLIEPLSAENLIGEASTSGVPATATTTALSTTFIPTSFVPPIFMADYEVSGTGPSTKVPSPLKIVFEKEELETTPEHGTSN